jgi:hypothetical protein
MTVLPWPAAPVPGRRKSARKLIVDPLPRSVLHSFVADLPGPKDETESERAVRFEAQLAEVLGYNPRDSSDAMIATHCVLLRLLAEDSHRDARRPGLDPAQVKQLLRGAKQLDKLLAEMKRTLARRQAQTPGKMDPAMFVALGLEQFLVPVPDDPDEPEEAFSAIIVPLHPAPKLLQ